MAFNHDDAMVDVQNVAFGPTIRNSFEDISVSADGLVDLTTHSGPALLNGNQQNSVSRGLPESLTSAAKSVKHSSRDSSAPDVHEQLSIESLQRLSPTKTTPFSDDVLSEDPESEMSFQSPRVSVAMLPTGLCYDVRMRYHCELDPPKQRLDFHPEDPRRIYYIYRELCRAGLVAGIDDAASITSKFLHKINIRYATKEEICLVHDAKHFEFVKSTKGIIETQHFTSSSVVIAET